MIEPSYDAADQDVDEKASQKIQYEPTNVRPIIGEDEIEFLKNHGMLKSILVGHKKFIKRANLKVGNIDVTVPNLLQETGIMSGSITTERHMPRK